MAPAFVQIDPLPRNPLPCESLHPSDSFSASFFLLSFLAPLPPGLYPIDLILSPPTYLLLLLFSPRLVYPAKY